MDGVNLLSVGKNLKVILEIHKQTLEFQPLLVFGFHLYIRLFEGVSSIGLQIHLQFVSGHYLLSRNM